MHADRRQRREVTIAVAVFDIFLLDFVINIGTCAITCDQPDRADDE